jgi:acyl carrier protein
MEINDFISHVAAQYDDVEENEFSPDTKFKEFDEWCSLTALSIIAEIAATYSVRLKGSDMRQVNTIQELFDVVQSKLR